MTERHAASVPVLTLGHSTLPVEVFLSALLGQDCALLIDVRTVPRSRHNPQFAQENLEPELRRAGIAYAWMRALGGLRHARKDSINTGWKNASFRGYADYMQTEEFAAAVQQVMDLRQQQAPQHCVLLCAEAVPWRCHRSLIGDALLVRGIPVEDLYVKPDGSTQRKPHRLTGFAHVEGLRITYPGPAQVS